MGGRDARKLPKFCKKNQVQPVKPAKPGRAGDYCDAAAKCGRRAPVCNFDDGNSGVCKRCPRDCIRANYNNQKGEDICCELCSNANSNCAFTTNAYGYAESLTTESTNAYGYA